MPEWLLIAVILVGTYLATTVSFKVLRWVYLDSKVERRNSNHGWSARDEVPLWFGGSDETWHEIQDRMRAKDEDVAKAKRRREFEKEKAARALEMGRCDHMPRAAVFTFGEVAPIAEFCEDCGANLLEARQLPPTPGGTHSRFAQEYRG